MPKPDLKLNRKPRKSKFEVEFLAHENALFFRQGVGEGAATLTDGRKVEVEMSTNVAGSAPLVQIRTPGDEGWVVYSFSWQELVKAACMAHVGLFPKGRKR